MLAGCVTSDLTGTDYAGAKAELVLYTMASSNMSMKCMVAAIDGRNVRKLQSWQLTTEYLIPAGSHVYRFVCEESAGSIPLRNYNFVMTFDTMPGGRYGLMWRHRRDGIACIVVKDEAKANETPLAEYCLS